MFWLRTGVPPLLAIAIPAVFFCLWCLPSFWGRLISARRTAVAFAFVSAGSALVFGFGWHFGLQYQGYTYTLTTAVISFVSAVIVLFMLILSSRRSSLPLRLAVNFILFAWAFTYAFPYLGELP